VLATENPIELEGTFALPEAELDRFLVRLTLGYPTRDAELQIAQRYRSSAEPLDSVPAVLDGARIQRLRAVVRGQTFAPEVLEYLVDLVRATRELPELRLGASPRSTVAMYRAAQAWSFLEGRRFVLPEDVRAVAPAVLGHRLLVDIDRRLRGTSPEEVIETLLRTVPVPLAAAS
jgi:MoxR-like ATPase